MKKNLIKLYLKGQIVRTTTTTHMQSPKFSMEFTYDRAENVLSYMNSIKIMGVTDVALVLQTKVFFFVCSSIMVPKKYNQTS